MESPPSALAQYFDTWFASMARSPAVDEIQQLHLGLPPGLLSTSLLTWEGIAEVTGALRLSPGALPLDLACGRGGYGLEVAARTGARLAGVDFSAEAIHQARGRTGGWAARRRSASQTSPPRAGYRLASAVLSWMPSSSPRARTPPTASCAGSSRPADGWF